MTVAAADPVSGVVRVALGPEAAARYPDITGPVRVQTARHDDAVVATTLAEADPG